MQQKIKNIIVRSKILQQIRKWFNKNSFIEVETPILVDCPDLSPNLNILQTEIHTNNVGVQNFEPLLPQRRRHYGMSPSNEQRKRHSEMSPSNEHKYLITSPEFSMKKLLSLQEMNNIFTITKVFRDGEEETGIHSAEFTMLEWYRKNANYDDIMRDAENLIKYTSTATISISPTLASENLLHTPFPRQARDRLSKDRGGELPLLYKEGIGVVFPRLKISSLFKKYAHIEKVEELKLPVFTKIVHSRGYSKDKNLTYEQCFNLIFLNEVEPKLPKTPFFLIDYPAPLAALAKLKKNNPFIAERFELYINGIELCNGFSELTDGKEQLARFKKENCERRRLGKLELPIDYDLCKKLDLIGKAGGNALGIDRLVMILLGAKTIDEVIYI